MDISYYDCFPVFPADKDNRRWTFPMTVSYVDYDTI